MAQDALIGLDAAKMTEADLKRLRAEFPILSTRIGREPLAYFDNAATTQKPRVVIDALTHYYRKQNANVHRAAHQLAAEATQRYEQARTTVADWLKVDAREIIWTRGTTEAINLVAQAFLAPKIEPGDRILLLLSNHHANILPWQQIALSRGAKLEVVGLTASGELDQEQYAEYLADKPKFVALTQVSNALGTVYPIAQMVKQAKAAGAWVLVDGAQALPHFDVELGTLDADFYTFSGHKTFGPTGIGVLYGRYELLEQMPPWQTGGEMIERVSFRESIFAPPPLRFEAGTPNIAGAIGLAEAIKYLNQRDRTELEAHEQRLLAMAETGLRQIAGIHILPAGERRVALLSCTFDRFQVADVAAYLDSRGIAVRAGYHCAQPLLEQLGIDASLRISFAFYNTVQEVERLIQALHELHSSDLNPTVAELEISIQRIYEAPDWPSRFSALMQMSSLLPAAKADLRSDKWEVFGCATRTWMRLGVKADGSLLLETDAQSRLMQGLLYLIADQVNGKQISEIQPDLIEQRLVDLGFEAQLSQTRSNAVRHLLTHLRSLIQN